jgi:predicted RNase H-like HicB family nuclease
MKFTIIFHIDNILNDNGKGYWAESPDNPSWFISGNDFNELCQRIKNHMIPNLEEEKEILTNPDVQQAIVDSKDNLDKFENEL